MRFTSLVGRASELRDVLQMLDGSRLLTLTGPGGTGKTRLALAAAHAADGLFPGGICWAELAPAADPALVGQTVASQMGVPDTPGVDAAEAIAGHVGGRAVLIVLDNCEHLTAAVAGLTETAADGLPRPVLLATSREPLGSRGNAAGQSRRCPSAPPPGRHGGTALRTAGAGSYGRRSGSATAAPPPFGRSAAAWTACRWRSSWPPRGCGSCRPPSWPSASTTFRAS